MLQNVANFGTQVLTQSPLNRTVSTKYLNKSFTVYGDSELVGESNHPSTSSGRAVGSYPSKLSLTKHDKLSVNRNSNKLTFRYL